MANMSAILDRWGVISPWSAFFALGLMAKSMLVTIPPLLLLLDFWPLGRFGRDAAGHRHAERRQNISAKRQAPRFLGVVVDKLPLVALSIAMAAVTMLTRTHAPTTR